MKVIKHGKYFNDKSRTIDLNGKCENCGCEFKTYCNIDYDDPVKGSMSFSPDTDCIPMAIEPDFVYASSKSALVSSKRVIVGVTYSCLCPECKTEVSLRWFGERK